MTDNKIIELKAKRKKLLNEADKIREKLQDIGYEYQTFFYNQNDKDFVLFELPSIECFKTYIEFSRETDLSGYINPHHPLDISNLKKSCSLFNQEELAVLIKTLFQLQKGKEYGILTTGDMVEIPMLLNVYPRIHYIVGEKDKIKEYEEYDGFLFDKLNKFNFNEPQEDLIAIPQVSSSRFFDKRISMINNFGKKDEYYEYRDIGKNAIAVFDKQYNIFRSNLRRGLDDIHSHRDLFQFRIAEEDDFISNILYSIMIYKYNNIIVELSDEDYAKIIYTLYNREVEPISVQSARDITKKLAYVKDNRSRE